VARAHPAAPAQGPPGRARLSVPGMAGGGGGALRRALARLALLALGVLLLLALAAAGARLDWRLELAVHFRPQYAGAALVLALLLAWLRRPWAALVAAVLCVVNAASLLPYLRPVGGVAAPPAAELPRDATTRLVAVNLYYLNGDYAAARDYLLADDADVLVLSELTPGWVRELRPVTDRYPHWLSVDRRSPWGLGVYSRHPLRQARFTNLGVRGSSNVVARVEAPAGSFELVAVHLSSPTSRRNAAFRDRQLRELAQLLGPPRTAGTPRLLVGDMNITPFSPMFGDLLAATGMEDARRPHGLHGTWPAPLPAPFRIPIDHCIADPGAGVASVVRGPEVGSDHFPLEIVLAPAR